MVYASWIRRFGGFLIDAVVAFLPSFAAGVYYETTVDASGAPSALGRTVDLIGIVVAAGVFVYLRWIRAGRTGQSLGRRIVNVRLVGEQSGQPIGVGRAALRDVTHVVDTLAVGVGWLFPLWDRKHQTFADKLGGTVVVRTP